MERTTVDIRIACKNADILQNAINRMSDNSARCKALYLPYVGIMISILFTIAFSTAYEWFQSLINRVVLGIIITSLLLFSSAIFCFFDSYYLTTERKLRKIYKDYCVNIELSESSLSDNKKNKIVDVASELKNNSAEGKFQFTVWLYYPVFFTIIVLSYFLLIYSIG